MNQTACEREDDVIGAVVSGVWPSDPYEELRAHARRCDLCGEAATIAGLLQDEGAVARGHARLPSAGQIWWRSAVRSRLERAHASTQPIGWLHGIAAALLVGTVLAAIGSEWQMIVDGAAWLKTRALTPEYELSRALVGALRQSAVAAAFAVACMVVAPVAVYMALRGD